MSRQILTHSELLQLKRWNTPTIYNGWEAITKQDRTLFTNQDETRDYMQTMGPMIGYAVTLKIEPSNAAHQKSNPNAWAEYRKYIASVPGPKIVVIQDMDHPRVIGSFWGEVNANVHRAMGCVGTITDGAIRDVDEMHNAGFKALARRLCVGHAYSIPVEWGVEVEVFGTKIKPGQLIHADKHGFLVIPDEDQAGILHAARFMDTNECNTVIQAARTYSAEYGASVAARINEAGKAFKEAARREFSQDGEW